MDKDLMQFFKSAFLNQLRAIRSDIENNGGIFGCPQQIDDALDCVTGLKRLGEVKVTE